MSKNTEPVELDDLELELQQAQEALIAAQESERRSLADYQNLVRRTQADRIKMAKMANQELVVALLQPLDHLELAAKQINDQGLTMVVTQLWQTLNQQGLEKLDIDGKKFDPVLMEVVDKNGEGDVVTSVLQQGYQLNGEVIQPAKVVVGTEIKK
ncbi:MAG: nucleotide exchange factor GrpE [bacterium]|nr:nucleotide exchange factor GrpE [bacterium]